MTHQIIMRSTHTHDTYDITCLVKYSHFSLEYAFVMPLSNSNVSKRSILFIFYFVFMSFDK